MLNCAPRRPHVRFRGFNIALYSGRIERQQSTEMRESPIPKAEMSADGTPDCSVSICCASLDRRRYSSRWTEPIQRQVFRCLTGDKAEGWAIIDLDSCHYV